MSATVEVSLKVTGMHCASCGLLVDDALEDLPGVVRATTDSRAGRSTVQVDLDTTSVDEMLAAIESAGYGATPESPPEGR